MNEAPSKYSADELAILQTWIAQKTSYLEWYRSTIPASYSVPRHVEYICGLVQKVIDGEIQRLAISTPPGHGKSETLSRRLPLYWAQRNPEDAIVLTGYSQTFADKNLSYQARELARELGLLGDKATALDEWRFKSGARLVSRGVGSAPTGINPISLLVCDDPIKDRAQAASEVQRENIWQWWQGSIIQRFLPRTRAVVIATRWHEDDLIGRLKASKDETWTFVNLPAIAIEDDPMGREAGQALWPEAKPIEFLEAQRLAMGDYEFQALFQGNPSPREGSFFKVGMVEIVDAAPAGLPTVRAWDYGASEASGDPTEGVRMCGPDKTGYYYIEGVTGDQWGTDERDRQMVQTAGLDGREVRIRLPQEPGAAGKSMALYHIRMLAGFSVRAYPISGDKMFRADPLSAQVNAGNVKLVKGDWNRALIEEFRQFPNGKFDNKVDACADAFTDLAGVREITFY